jgi:hypothetical protein
MCSLVFFPMAMLEYDTREVLHHAVTFFVNNSRCAKRLPSAPSFIASLTSIPLLRINNDTTTSQCHGEILAKETTCPNELVKKTTYKSN